MILRNLILFFLLATSQVQAHQPDQRHEITHLVQELDYLIDITREMRKRYSNPQHAQYEYGELLSQLISARNLLTEQLNAEIKDLKVESLKLFSSPSDIDASVKEN